MADTRKPKKKGEMVLGIDPGVTTGMALWRTHHIGGWVRTWELQTARQVVEAILTSKVNVVVIEDFTGSRPLNPVMKETIEVLGAAKAAVHSPVRLVVQNPAVLQSARRRFPEVKQKIKSLHERSAAWHVMHYLGSDR